MSPKSRIAIAALAAALALTPALGAKDKDKQDDSLNFVQVRLVLRDARKAMEQGKLADALDAYQRVLKGADGEGAHAEALYSIALIRLSDDPALADREDAVAKLTALAHQKPEGERGLATRVLLGLLDAADRARAETTDVRTELKQTQAQNEELRKKVSELEAAAR